MNLKAIAIDDEPLALSVIELFCGRTDFIELEKTFTNGTEALPYIGKHPIDLVFLDISMPQIDGMELARMFPPHVMIIFTTAYQDYAVQGFELQAVDYLLKPFPFARFQKAALRAKERRELQLLSQSSEEKPPEYMIIKSDYASVRVEIPKIIAIEGLKDYVKIYTPERNYITKSTMKRIAEFLEPYGFLRVHKSFIVNCSLIISAENGQIKLPKNLSVPIGNQYKEEFSRFLSAKMLP